MKKEMMELWCNALESGKFSQIKGQLRDIHGKEKMGYCCLGVACHLVAPAAWNNKNSVIKNSLGSLPSSIKNYFGLHSSAGDFTNIPKNILKKYNLLLTKEEAIERNEGTQSNPYKKGNLKVSDLTELNDELGWSFKQISAFIRDTYKYL